MGPVAIPDAEVRSPSRTLRAASETRTAGSRSVLIGGATLVLIATTLSFGLQSRLVWDDLALISELDARVSAHSWVEVFASGFFDRDPESSDVHYYRPLVTASYLLGAVIWDGDPFSYSLSNLVFHLVTCGLLFAVLLRFGATPWGAAGGTALFGLMPRLTESVFWISGRTDILATLFVLAALLVYRSADSKFVQRAVAGVFLFLALLCKEVAIAGLIGLTILELAQAARRRRSGEPGATGLRTFVIHVAPLWLALFLYLGIRLAALGGLWQTSLSLDLGQRLGLAAEALGRYALMLLDPLHPALRIGSIFAPRDTLVLVLGIGIAIAGMAALSWLSRRDDEGVPLLGLALGGASIALVLHLVPFGSDSLAADRFLYMPVVALSLVIATGVARLPRIGRRIAAGCAAVALLAFAASSLERAEQWHDDARLWYHTLQNSDPHDSIPDSWLGIALLERDEPTAALAHFEEALRIETSKPPEYRKRSLILELLANTSVALSMLGRDDEALHAIDQALGVEPTHVAYLVQRARVLGRLLRFGEARTTLTAAIDAGGDASVLSDLSKELQIVAQAFDELSESAADESIARRVARARLYERIGAIASANTIWHDVVAGPDVSTEYLFAAARFHTFRADPAQAEALISDLATRLPGHSRELEILRAAVAQRRRQAVPQEILGSAAAGVERS